MIESEQKISERINEILNHIKDLFDLRLVQKLAKPCSQEIKRDILDSYSQTFCELHERLHELREIMIKEHKSDPKPSKHGKNKSYNNSGKNKQIYHIGIKYREVLIEGSFKHFSKVCKFSSLIQKLKPINISAWLAQILKGRNHQTRFCC